MRNLRLKIEYDGNNYYGWQIQPNKKTVQGEIIKAIKSITGEEVELIGSGRTDTGVCAYSQVANFKLNKEIELNKLKLGLNSKLKGNIVIKDIEEVSQEFHSRFNAKKKTYIYIINNNEVPSALTKNKEYYYKRKLDVNKMNNAIKYLIGEHDFKAFKSSGSPKKTTVRTIYDAEVKLVNTNILGENKDEDKRIVIKLTGNGFLYNMVRIIAGTVLEVGEGKIKASEMKNILESKNREKAGKTLPATGLFLYNVEY